MEVFGWIIGFYIVNICLGIFAYQLNEESKERVPEPGLYIFAALCPGFNILGTLCFILEITEQNKHIPKVLNKMNIPNLFMDEESKKEQDEAREQMETAIRAAKRLYKNKTEIIKRKSEKRKFCYKLGLTLEDLDAIKKSREPKETLGEIQEIQLASLNSDKFTYGQTLG